MPSCAACGQENPDIARFCLGCGAALPGNATAGREERRIVTVLFVDLVGFTSRAERLDPEDVRALLTPYYERVRAEMEQVGGIVEKFVGDAVMGVFGAPVAFGDDPERAVRAALSIRAAINEMNAADPELGLQIRAAVNTGEALVALGAQPGRGDAMVAGDVVNTASRLQSAAPVNCVLVGAETFACTRSAIRYEPAPPVIAKGKAEPVAAWLALEPIAPAGERTLSLGPMVGRGRELGILQGIWDSVSAERRPHLVTVFGPAGIGKTRLAAEFAQIVERAGARAIRGRCWPYGDGTPYGAFAQQVKRVAEIFDSDTLSVAVEKLRAAAVRCAGSEDADELADHLGLLVGLATEGRAAAREDLFFSARCFVESVAEEQPTLLVFEDLHWADPSLLDLVEHLASRLHDRPVLLLALARADLLTVRPGWGGGLGAYTALPVEPLDAGESEQLASRLLTERGGAAQAFLLAETAEGNPLFIEELAASLAERATAGSDELPTTIRAIVSSRLDSLPQAERAVLLGAAVVGKVFWRGALARLADDVERLPEVLASLEQRDLIRRDAVSRIQGDQEFAFKHVLIRDVAYATLPRAKRREWHGEVARFLEQATPEVGESAAVLAFHWREAGEPDRAVRYLTLAAEQAARGWAKERVVALYAQALELVPEEDVERRRDLLRRQAVAHQALYHVLDARLLGRGGEAV